MTTSIGSITSGTSGRMRAPDFTGPASHGAQVKLADYRGRYLVLFFFPASFTFGCTRETARFRDLAAKLSELGADVVGVSPDSVQTQCEFASHYQVPFPIVADTDRRIATAFGALFRFVSRVKRTTFIIDPEGCIAARIHHELRFERHADDAVAYLSKVRQRAQQGSSH